MSNEYFQRLLAGLCSSSASRWTPRGSSSRPRSRRPCCTGPRTRCTSATRTATAASAATTPRSRACCPSSSAGTRTPTATSCGTSTRATCATCPVPSATAPGSSPRSSRSSSTAGPSPRSPTSRSARPRSGSAPWSSASRERAIADRVLKEIQARLSFLVDVGLDYLSLDRPAATLAGGEAQRIRLATQIGSGLVGVLYVLDEPSIGLHQRDNTRLIETLVRLRDMGNTLIVVEHDEDTIKIADWIVDIGPGAGEHGGEVVVSGSLDELMASERSLTGHTCPVARRSRSRRSGASRPRAASWWSRAPASTTSRASTSRSRSACWSPSPVSPASGKSSLVNDILYTTLANQLNRARMVPGRHRTVTGLEHLDKVVHVDQSPIGRTPRSNPATYTGVWDQVRKLFAEHDRGEDARLPAGPLLVQRQGRPLRGVLRRRHAEDRDELPAGRLRPLRGVQGRPVQPGDPRGALQGQDGRRGPRHADRGGRRLLRGHPGDRPVPAHPHRGRAGLRPAGPAGDRPCPVARRSG